MAAMELRQQLKLSQQLVMTPQLQQAIKLLQLSRMELVDVVRQEMEENPMLEEHPDIPERNRDKGLSEDIPEQNVAATSQPTDAAAVKGANDIDWEKYLENHANQAPAPGGRVASDDQPAWDASLKQKDSLTEHLRWQMRMAVLSDEEETFLDLVIGNLDADGYLKEPPLSELAQEAGLLDEDAEEVLKMLHGFDPVGVGARNLRECLLAQVEALELDADVREIIDRHLGNLEKRNYQAIAKDMELSIEDVYEASKIVGSLEPRPARNFVTEDPRFIVPDVYVYKIGDKYYVIPNDDGLPRLKISGFFRSAMDADPNAREYVQNKLRSAQWLIRSIDQRRRTIVKVTECIVEKQHDFFERGVDFLKPMILRDVAEAVEMHESTISRVTTNKYVHTPQGIFELKYFFNSSIRRMADEDIASESVKSKIKEIVAAEDQKRPLSDQRIVEILAEHGIVIARRTVAKYREMLGILSSSKRKRYF